MSVGELVPSPVRAGLDDRDPKRIDCGPWTETQHDRLLRVRRMLHRQIWSDAPLPRGGPDAVQRSWNGVALAGSARVDRLRFDLPYGLRSFVYHAVPRAPVRPARAIIIHHGHEPILQGCEIPETTEYFLRRGYHTLSYAMPLWADNPTGSYVTARSGPVTLSAHADFFKLDLAGEAINPLRVYVDPVVRGVTYVLDEMKIARLAMAGLSGGGWTTHISAALDVRIKLSYAVAGFMPHDSGEATDYEQDSARRIYSIAPVRTLFALSGLGRRHWQVLNHRDRVFAYVGREVFADGGAWPSAPTAGYVKDAQELLLGNDLGFFGLRVDTTTSQDQHVISADTRAWMARDIEASS